ncbi:hypothetical protein DL762_010105 [Monosporascus cannonballus]|uniref:Uncharacterized protein n=1 Tax=Monosporascus cannonballus TaxID=155416 RepID=A0ABY0GRY6_9PEZI|nr:hypothetical protein DL762_010105 [Monosporascus cannonballus]RYO75946.1 hypothetical protein DL763_010860 [Monosporascus cannonballus]
MSTMGTEVLQNVVRRRRQAGGALRQSSRPVLVLFIEGDLGVQSCLQEIFEGLLAVDAQGGLLVLGEFSCLPNLFSEPPLFILGLSEFIPGGAVR